MAVGAGSETGSDLPKRPIVKRQKMVPGVVDRRAGEEGRKEYG